MKVNTMIRSILKDCDGCTNTYLTRSLNPKPPDSCIPGLLVNALVTQLGRVSLSVKV
jgi:hypothetical protein